MTRATRQARLTQSTTRSGRYRLRSGRTRLVTIIVAMSLGAIAAASGLTSVGANHSATPTGPFTPSPRAVVTSTGTFSDGATWIIRVPEGWSGVLLLFAHGRVPPNQPNPAVGASDPATATHLLNSGYALAGSSFATTGGSVEDAVRKGNLDHKEAGRLLRFYEDALRGYTYLEEPEA